MKLIRQTVLIAVLSLMATACGRRGALLYPDMLVPAAPSAATAQQSGSSVKIQFVLPDKDRAGRPLQGVAGVKISKRAFETDQQDICRSCPTDYALFRTLYLDHLPTAAQRFGSRMVIIDSEVRTGSTYAYQITPFTSDGVDGASSPSASVRVTAPPAPPVLTMEPYPTELNLHISRQPVTPGRPFGYNLYRSSPKGPRTFLPLNREPLQEGEYRDQTVERGVTYRYTARTVVVSESGDSAESPDSNEVAGKLKDDE